MNETIEVPTRRCQRKKVLYVVLPRASDDEEENFFGQLIGQVEQWRIHLEHTIMSEVYHRRTDSVAVSVL